MDDGAIPSQRLGSVNCTSELEAKTVAQLNLRVSASSGAFVLAKRAFLPQAAAQAFMYDTLWCPTYVSTFFIGWQGVAREERG